MDKIISAIKLSGTIREGTVVIVGVSGGPDSLCLLHALNQLKDSLKLTLFPVHINHKLRKKATSEQKHIEKLCKEMGLECNSFVVDCKAIAKENKISDEEAGRLIRYDAFSQCAEQLEQAGIDRSKIVIAVAHNADDQSETIIQRIMRGTGLKGLTGMSPARYDEKGFVIVRPLLDVTRSDIEAYIEANKLEPNIDESNQSTEYTRNKIRLELLPYMEENFNPNVKESLRNLANIAAIDDNYMAQVAGAMYQEAVSMDTADEAIILDTEKASEMHVAILRRVIGLILAGFGLDSEISYELIGNVLELIFTDKPSAMMNLPAGLVARREYRKLIFCSAEEKEENPIEGIKLAKQIINADAFVAPEKGMYAVFDYDKFCEKHPGQLGEIEVRTRKRGDVIGIGDGKHKKIQNYFVDAKIPASYRDMVALVAVGGEVLWVLPNDALPTKSERNKGKFSQNYQFGEGSKRVLFLEIVNGLW